MTLVTRSPGSTFAVGAASILLSLFFHLFFPDKPELFPR